MQTYLLLAAAVVTAVLSQLLFKKGIAGIGGIDFSPANLLVLVKTAFSSPYILVGLIFYGASFLAWLMVLSKSKLSVVYPITSLNFVLVVVASYIIFGEKISHIQVLGIAVIITGVILLAGG